MKPLAPGSANTVAAQPLYAIEEYLAVLVDTAELVPPDQEQEFRDEFQLALTTAVDKRDRVGQFMAHIEQQITFANYEIDRLRERKAAYQRAFDRIENYVTHTIEVLGRDAKGKYRRLEGKTVTFSLAGCPPSVEVTDESAVPAEYKTLTLKLPAVDLGADPRLARYRSAAGRGWQCKVPGRFDRQARDQSRNQLRDRGTGGRPRDRQDIAQEDLRMKPRRDSKYLQWIRTLPCSVCGSTRNIEAAHTGAHGLGQKAPDSSAIPLCITHHRYSEPFLSQTGTPEIRRGA